MIDTRTLPELEQDETLQALVDTFNARLISAESEHSYVGNWTPCVKLGEAQGETLTLPTVRLVYACEKAELERSRATLFAAYLLKQEKTQARALWDAASENEAPEFMRWTLEDIKWKRSH